MVYIFCDNDAVVEVLDKERPKDLQLQELLREFMYVVCTRKFSPIFKKIGTKENFVADQISRSHDPDFLQEYFLKNNIPARTPIEVPDSLFLLKSNW